MTDSILDQMDNTNRDYFSELVGEGKKYRDQQELAKAYFNADTHIKTLEQKSDELRTDYLKEREANQTRARLEDLLKKFEGKDLTSSNQPLANEESKPTIDLTAIDTRFDARLREYENAKKEQENLNIVKSKLQERYGDNFAPAVKQQIDTLGLTKEAFDTLAKQSPVALLKTLGIDDTRRETFQAPPRSSNFVPKGEPKKTWSYYQQLKKDNPRLYHSQQITNEMTRQLELLGDEFKDGDYSKFGD